MTFEVRIDESSCVAHGACVDIAPEVFELDDVAAVVAPGPDALVLAAAESCPSTAIVLLDRTSGEQVYP